MSSFNGFDKHAVAFLQSLQANNTRDWFNDHKKDYERLDSWPLALTGYNHGAAGMGRAKRRLGTKPEWKKAIVQLAEGQSIDVTTGL